MTGHKAQGLTTDRCFVLATDAGGHRGGGAPAGDGSLIGTRYRWTTREMQARVMAAIEQRLAVSLAVAARPSSED